MKVEVEADIDRMRGQIEDARRKAGREGIFADPVWFRNVNTALRIKGRQAQQIQAQLSALRSARGLLLPQTFMSVAREKLPPEQFQAVYDEAKRRVAEAKHG